MSTVTAWGTRVLARLAQLDEARREILFASLLLLVLFVVGTAGYALIEGWTVMDGLYMTFITLTTIGFREVNTLTTTGRIFTIAIGVTGIGSVAFVAARTMQLLLASERLHQRHLARRIRSMYDHYIICGYGRIGRRVAEDLQHAGTPFVVIDRDDAHVEDLQTDGVPALRGDAEDEETLRQARIDHARGLILTLPEDSTTVFVTLVAREMNPGLFILARTNDVKNRRKMLQAGASKVIAPSDVGADRMAQVILRPHVDRFMEQVLKTTALGLQMDEVRVENGAPLAGRSLSESQFRQRFDAIVIAVIDGNSGVMRFNPSPGDKIMAGDVLIVLGNQDVIGRLRRDGCSASAV